MNVFDAIEHQARLRPQAPAVLTAAGSIEYARLVERVRRAAAVLRGRGLRAGDVVGMLPDDGGIRLELALALARIGAVGMPVAGTTARARLGELAARFRLAALIGADARQGVDGVAFLDAGPWLFGPDERSSPQAPSAGGGERVFEIALCAGPLGEVRGIARSHAWVLEQSQRLGQVWPVGPGVRCLVFLGADRGLACEEAVRLLLSGAAVVLPSASTFEAFADAVERLGATHAVSSTQAIAGVLERCASHGPRFPQLAGLRLIGSRVEPALHRALEQRVCAEVFLDYGFPEVGTVASGERRSIGRDPPSVGRIVPWLEAQAVDDHDRPVSAGRPGVLRLRGASLARGYHEDPQASARSFRGGWFYPGAFGTLAPDGHLLLDTASFGARYKLALSLFRQGRLGELRAVVQEIRDPDVPSKAPVLVTLANLLARARLPERALPLLERVAGIDPANVDAWRVRGNACQAMGRIDEAIEHYRRALQLLGANIDPRPRPSPGRPAFPGAGRAALLDAKAALDAAGLPFFLVFGTLLGIVRGGDLLPFDKDLDLGMWASVDRERVLRALVDGGRFLVTDEFLLTRESARQRQLSFLHRGGGVVVDIDFFHDEGDRLCAGIDHLPVPLASRLRRFGLREQRYLEHTWLIPDPPERFLEDMYGPQWRVPQPDFDSVVSSHCLAPESKPIAVCFGYSRLCLRMAQGEWARAAGYCRQILAHRPDPLLEDLLARLSALPTDRESG